MRKRKTDTGQAGESVVDYRHKSSKRLNIPPAGLEALGGDCQGEADQVCLQSPSGACLAV